MAVLVICPSRGRPDKARETLASFLETRADPDSRLIFVVDNDDRTRPEYPEGHVYVSLSGGSYVPAVNLAVRDPRVLGEATSVGFIGDDNRFRSHGWDVELDGWLSKRAGIAYPDDGHQAEHLRNRGHRMPTTWWLSRPVVERFGLAPSWLNHFWVDNYWYELGDATESLRYFADVLIEHLHPLWQTATNDAVYDRSSRHAQHDKVAYQRWLRQGKALDVSKLRAVMRGTKPRKVLADWHHPALWESLRILVEQRFGWELYSPIGKEWLARGWRFEHEKWSALDYLTFPDVKPVNGHFERTEAEYPEHKRKLLTVAQADAIKPDVVIATVAAHQHSFAELAAGWGAQYVYQVGNARQPVDFGTKAIVLASAILPRRMRPRQLISYHQEFDRNIFAPAPIKSPSRVVSFMLRLDRTSCDWRWLSDAKGVTWKSFGGDDQRAPTYLAPMSRVASEMRNSGWIWHDKKIGDGYGHVVHNAAAMGRPLIGHGSHYKGMLAEPYWQDMKTCIDLDKHDSVEALRLLRAISADPEWHADMSRHISEEFDKRVNFDAEAEQIRAALA